MKRTTHVIERGFGNYYTKTEVDALISALSSVYAPLLVTVTSKSGDANLSAAECSGRLILVTQTATMTLPEITSTTGYLVTVYSTTAASVMVDCNANDRIILDGTAGGGGKKITSASGAGDYVTLVAESGSGWTVIGRSGTWTMES